MSDGVRVVALGPRRLPEFHTLLDRVARERRWLAMVEAPALEDVTHFVLESQLRGGIHLAALRRGQMLGWCDIRRMERPGSAHVGRLGMGVHPEHRGAGVGGALLREALQRAAGRALWRIELEVFSSNRPAIALYRRLGFVTEGVRKDAWRLDDWHEDILEMARLHRSGDS